MSVDAYPYNPELYAGALAVWGEISVTAAVREWARRAVKFKPVDLVTARADKVAVLADPMFGLGRDAAETLVTEALAEAMPGRKERHRAR